MTVVNLEEAFGRFSAHWSPKIVGQLNGQLVKLAKLRGEFVWHDHPEQDELFLVVRGTLRIKLEDRELTLQEGEFTIVPRGVRHLPIADEEVCVLLLEPEGTHSTGGVEDPRGTHGEWL